MINTSPRSQAGFRGRECVYATLWKGTRPQSLLGKKAAAQEMWCNRNATVPLGLFTPQHAKVVFISALCGFRAQFPAMSIWLVAIYQTALDIQCVKSNHGTSVLSEHITIHSHFNKSIYHISVYRALFVFNNSVHTNMSVPAVL